MSLSAYEIVRKATERAMERHRLSQRALASAVGCGPSSIANMLDNMPVRLNQEQYIALLSLAGMLKGG